MTIEQLKGEVAVNTGNSLYSRRRRSIPAQAARMSCGGIQRYHRRKSMGPLEWYLWDKQRTSFGFAISYRTILCNSRSQASRSVRSGRCPVKPGGLLGIKM